MTIVEMLEQDANRFPEKTAIIFGNSRISYRTFYERAIALANFLIAMGLKKGDRVGLVLRKTPEVLISFLGVAAAGGVVFPIDYNQTLASVQFSLDLTEPSLLIVDEGFQPLIGKLRHPSCPDKKIIVVGNKSKNHRRSWEEVFVQKPLNPPGVEIQEGDVVYLNFTTGTTGLPKGAITTHANIFWNTLSAVESLGLTKDDIHLCMFPVFSHPHELFARPLYLGGTIVLTDSIYPKSIATVISEHRVTCMMAVASIYDTLARLPRSSSFDLSSLRIPESGGMHTNPTLSQKFRERFEVPIIPVWGSTETSGIAVSTPVKGEHRPGSIGNPSSYYQVKVVGENGEELPPDEVGEMAVKGPGVCSGYYNQPEETEIYMKDGWFLTGDMVTMDREGYYYFKSRKTGMMKVAGLKVFPTEIEDVLINHPKIKAVAVVKAQDNLHGEVPKAVIVAKNGVEISKGEIREYCEEKLSRYKVPRIIEFRSELPKTPGGKILYRGL
ncbi:MAG: AMP-binding protein, partial [Syntrophales bacterium]|nr:AMP-binding protein [Syntrophales bacterium]